MYHLHHVKKSYAVAGFLGLVGIIAFLPHYTDYLIALPLFIFYITIVVNTHFSIKLFASITPKEDIVQHIVDTLLVLTFVCMSINFSNPLIYSLFLVFLFALASLKYSLLLITVPHQKLLKRKIVIDILGTVMAIACLAGMLFQFESITAWTLAIVFIIANVILLGIKPMYVPDFV